MRRQNILTAVFALLLCAAAVAYFAFIRPLSKADEDSVDSTDAPETEEGESTSVNGRLYMFSSLGSDDIASLTVENEYGSFTFKSDEKGEFAISGHENVPYSKEQFVTLVDACANTLSRLKVGSGVSDEKIAEYGLDDPQASWTVTDKKGNVYRVLVGDRLLTGGGYYCMFEGRRSVYVLGNEVADTVLVPIENYITPIMCTISKDDYYVTDNFTVYKNGEMLMRLHLLDKRDQINPDALAENIMDYPAEYYPDSTEYYDVIYSYMNLTADSCYKLGADSEDMKEVGLDEPAHRITFDYKNVSYELCFSEQTDGVYYAYSNMYPDVIGTFSADKLKYLEFELIDWINEYIFRQYITNVSEIKIETGDVKADFELEHSIDENDKEVLNVKANGDRLSSEACSNFRQYYKSLLAIAIAGYVEGDEYCTMSDNELAALASDPENAYLRFEYTTLAGTRTELCFYRYSTRHSLMTVNGKGEFYVLTDVIKKIENDTVRVLNGETVVSGDKY